MALPAILLRLLPALAQGGASASGAAAGRASMLGGEVSPAAKSANIGNMWMKSIRDKAGLPVTAEAVDERKRERESEAERKETEVREKLLSAIKGGTAGLIGLAIAAPALSKKFSDAQLAVSDSLREYNASIAKSLNLLEFHRFQRNIQMASEISAGAEFASKSRDMREAATQELKVFSQNVANIGASLGDLAVVAGVKGAKTAFPVVADLIKVFNWMMEKIKKGDIESAWGAEFRDLAEHKRINDQKRLDRERSR